MTVALIDGDILAYQAAVVSEKETNWGDGLWTLHAYEEDGMAAFETTLNGILNKLETESCIIAFTDSAHNWRKDVLPTYKGNRAGTRKPMLLKFLRQWANDRFVCKTMDNLEGDDVLGIISTQFPEGDYVMCTIDKDLKTIPGKHYNFGTGEIFEIDQDTADYWHMIQTLTGDVTDGYSGCPGVGIKTAEKLLLDVSSHDRWDVVVKAYKKAGLGEAEALTQARVARILRASDFDEKNLKVKLWTPENSMMPMEG